ncbi:MAG: hypothetical protein QOH31_175 [Verrucomicrobiota bacterium]|jgi:hypothetical protein
MGLFNKEPLRVEIDLGRYFSQLSAGFHIGPGQSARRGTHWITLPFFFPAFLHLQG